MSNFTNSVYSVRDSIQAIKYLARAFETTGNASVATQLREISGEIEYDVGIMDSEYQQSMNDQLAHAMQGTSNMLSMAMAMDTLNSKVKA